VQAMVHEIKSLISFAVVAFTLSLGWKEAKKKS
jgi:hypothetical protein